MLSLPPRDPEGSDSRPASNCTTGQDRARWSHSSQPHPTRHGRPMAPACICKHLNSCCDPVGLERHPLSDRREQMLPVARAKSSPVGRRYASRSVAPSRRNMQPLISSRLPLVANLVAYWLCKLRRHYPATRGLQPAGTLAADRTPGKARSNLKLTDLMPSLAHHHLSLDWPWTTLLLCEPRRRCQLLLDTLSNYWPCQPRIRATGLDAARLANDLGSVGVQ